jgi:hypothetical protein
MVLCYGFVVFNLKCVVICPHPASENRKLNIDGVLLRPTRQSGRFSEGLLHRRSHSAIAGESIKRMAQLYGVEKQARGQSPVAPFCSGTLAPICTGIDRRAAASENWLQQGTNSLSYTPNGSTSDPFQPHGPNHIHKVHDTRSLSVTSVSPIELPYEPT